MRDPPLVAWDVRAVVETDENFMEDFRYVVLAHSKTEAERLLATQFEESHPHDLCVVERAKMRRRGVKRIPKHPCLRDRVLHGKTKRSKEVFDRPRVVRCVSEYDDYGPGTC